jgi:hypothetical protein
LGGGETCAWLVLTASAQMATWRSAICLREPSVECVRRSFAVVSQRGGAQRMTATSSSLPRGPELLRMTNLVGAGLRFKSTFYSDSRNDLPLFLSWRA